MKRAVATGFIVMLSVSLTGCTFFRNPTEPNIAFRSVEGHLEITVCRDVDLRALLVSQRPQAGEWEDLWDTPVDLHLSERDSITSAELPPGNYGEPRMAAGDELSVILNSSDPQILGMYAEVFVPAEGMPTAEWLMSDGTIRNDPCARVEDIRDRQDG